MKVRLTLIGASVLTGALAVAMVAHATRSDRSLTKITYETSYGTFGRDAYAYVALNKGYFKEAGFDVRIVPGAGTVAVATDIAAGKTQFGPGDPTAVAVARGENKLPVKVVALIQQKTMAGWIALRSSGIRTASDLAGKTVADTPGSMGIVLLPLFARNSGFDAKSVKFVPSAPQSLPSLLASGHVDAVGQFVVGIPDFEPAVGGKPLVFIPYAKGIPSLVGLGLLASDQMIAKHPDEVRRFTAALLKGERYAVDHPREAGAILHEDVPLANAQAAAAELKIMKPYVVTAAVKKHGLGYVDSKRLGATVKIVNQFFKPKTRVTLSEVYAPGLIPKVLP